MQVLLHRTKPPAVTRRFASPRQPAIYPASHANAPTGGLAGWRAGGLAGECLPRCLSPVFSLPPCVLLLLTVHTAPDATDVWFRQSSPSVCLPLSLSLSLSRGMKSTIAYKEKKNERDSPTRDDGGSDGGSDGGHSRDGALKMLMMSIAGWKTGK